MIHHGIDIYSSDDILSSPLPDLAADPDIDLVVSCVRVDKHYATSVPALRAGKAVFTEWPLGVNLAEAQEMAAIAKEHNARTIVGLQGPFSPLIRRVKELLDGGRIGKVLSSSYTAAPGNGGATEKWTVDYFTERKVGSNPVTVGVGHALESIEYRESMQARRTVSHPSLTLHLIAQSSAPSSPLTVSCSTATP